ncbi:hypothetical protein FPV67DRAFT_1227161 [Lyophyllum atratum]|nr:hypothetical protein FPV67DRAFT_1227161 [Lyophyllum atratum]
MAHILYQNWGAFRHLSTENSGVSFAMYMRLILFTLLAGIALGLSFVAVPRIDHHQPAPESWSIILTTIPVIAAIALGTQKDIMDTWMFWRWRTHVPPPKNRGSSLAAPLLR